MFKKFFEYSIFSIVSAAISLATIIGLTNLILPSDFGIVGLFMSVMYFLPQLVSFGALGLVAINKTTQKSEVFQQFSNSFFSIGLTNFLLILFLSVVLGSFFPEIYRKLFFLLPVYATLQFFNEFHLIELVQDEASKKYGFYKLLNVVVSSSMTFYLVISFKFTWDGRLYALILSELFVLLLSIKVSYSTLRNMVFRFDFYDWKEIFIFGLPLTIALAGGWLLNEADRFVVLHFFGLSATGIYAVAHRIGSAINLLNNSAVQAFTPIVYKSIAAKRGRDCFNSLFYKFSFFIMSFSAIVAISAYSIMPFFLGEKYHSGKPVIFLIALACGLSGVYRIPGAVVAFFKENFFQMKTVFAAAITNVLLSLVLIPYYGFSAPAISTLIAYLVLTILSYTKGTSLLKTESNEEID